MGIYRNFVLPRLIDCAMREPALTKCRSEIIPKATGRVLEVGIGSGLNFPFYGPEVSHVWGADPSAELLTRARSKVAALSFQAGLICASAEDLPLEDASADTVVLMWTLCSIPNPSRALRELRRVLEPGGSLLFAEHGLAPDPSVRTWQGRLTPLWKRIAGGCHLNRKIDELIAHAGFSIQELQTSYHPGPRVLTFMYQGTAV